jgi:hypothetical protein
MGSGRVDVLLCGPVDARATPDLVAAASAVGVPLLSTTGSLDGTGAGRNSAGTDGGESGVGTSAGYRSAVNTGPFAVFDSGLGRHVQMSDLTSTVRRTFGTETVFRQIINGPVTLTGDTTFQQCVINGNPTLANQSSSSGNGPMFRGSFNPTFVDCLIDGRGQAGGSASPYPTGYGYDQMTPVGGGPGNFTGMTILRCEIRGMIDILKQVDNCYVGYSWLHDFVHFYDRNGKATHCDHLQINGGIHDALYEYNTMGTAKSVALSAGTDKNGASGPAWSQYETLGSSGLFQIATTSSSATLVNLTVRYNYFNEGDDGANGAVAGTGGNTVYASVSNTLVSGNRCGPHQRFGAINGSLKTAAADGSTIDFDGTNVYDDNFTSYWGGANNGTAGKSYSKDQVFA